MLKIYVKTYNSFFFTNLIKFLSTQINSKSSLNYTVLPAKFKSFTVKKSPHVFGRSKEKYYLKTYLGVITLTVLRKKDLLTILKILKFFKNKEGLGLKFTIFN